jgi:hypothetical protein
MAGDNRDGLNCQLVLDRNWRKIPISNNVGGVKRFSKTRRARLRICRASFMQTCVNLESFAALGSGLCQHCSYLRSHSRQPLMRPFEIPENRAG